MIGRRAVLLALMVGCVGCSTAPAPAGPDSWDPVVAVVADRLATADTVAASKYVSKGPVEDPARERVVLDAATVAASAHGLEPRGVAAVVDDQIAASKVVQYGLLEEWTDQPAAAPVAPPDLAGVRTTLDAVTPRLVDALAAAGPARTDPACRTSVAAAGDRVATARTLDPLHRRGLDRALRSLCG